MSTSVEQRIVEMKFDNKGFSDGVQDTLKDLDTLDKATKFEGGIQGLKSLQRSADNVNFSALVNGVQSINDSLNHMQSFSFQVFENIARKAADTMTKVVRSLSVDQIQGGFKEYELKMDSIRTIMSSSGESLETVNKKLMELNAYSDKTIYSFSDMTSSIGKFTNAGVDLDAAVAAIQGISNEAALSGASANEASRAMYNFAQALSAGSVKLIDWKSIETANMATVEFKEELLKTALALGTVEKVEGGYISTTTNAQGKVSELFTSTTGFNESLNNQWMTTDVLVETLSRYADETTDIGKRAFAAAQEVTTFSKMMDALKESVGSGWAQTFELLFGDLEQAKKLWTGINNVIGGVIASVSDTRNGILEMWKAAGGHTLLLQALKDIWWIIENIAHYIGLALETITGHRYLQDLSRVKDFFADRKSFSGNLVIIQRMVDLMVTFSRSISDATRRLREYFNPEILSSRLFLEEIYQAAQAIIIPVRAICRVVGGITAKILPVAIKMIGVAARTIIFLMSRVGYALTEGGLQKNLFNLADTIVEGFGKALDLVSGLLEDFIKFLSKAFGGTDLKDKVIDFVKKGIEKLNEAVKASVTILKKIIKVIKQVKKPLDPVFEFVKKKVGELTTTLKDFWDNNKHIVKIKDHVTEFFKAISSPFKSASENPVKKLEETKEKIDELVKSGYTIEEAEKKVNALNGSFEDFGGMFTYVKGQFDKFIDAIVNSAPIQALKKVVDEVVELIKNNKIVSSITDFIEPIVEAFKNAFGDVDLKSTIDTILGYFDQFKSRIDELDTTNLGTMWSGFISAIGELSTNLKTFAFDKFDALMDRIQKFWEALKPEDSGVDEMEKPLYERMIALAHAAIMGLIEGIRTFDWSNAFKLIEGMFGLYLIASMIKLFKGGNKGLTGINVFKKIVLNFANSINAVIGMTKWDILAGALLKAAKAILVLAGALLVISIIPEDALDRAVTAVATIMILFGILMAVKGWADKMRGASIDTNKAATSMSQATASLVDSFKTCVENISVAIKAFLNKLAMGGLLIAFAVAVVILIKALKTLNDITEDKFVDGFGKLAVLLGTLLVIIGILTIIANIAPKEPNYLGISLLILSFAVVVTQFTKLIPILNAINWGLIFDAVGKMALIMVTMVGMLMLVNNFAGSGEIAKVSGAMILMAVALTALCVPILILSVIPVENLASAILAIAALVALNIGMTKAAQGMMTMAGGMKNFAIAIAGFIGVAVGLYIMAKAIEVLCAQAPEMAKYADVLINFTAIMLVVMFVIGVIGEAVGTGALMIAGAFALIGLGIGLAGAGIYAFAAAADLFSDVVIKFAENMDMLIESVNGRETQAANAIKTIVAAVVEGIMEGFVYIIAALVTGLNDAMKVLDEQAFELGLNFTSALFKFILGAIAGIVRAILDSLGLLGDWISKAVLKDGPLSVNPEEAVYAQQASAIEQGNKERVIPAIENSSEEQKKAWAEYLNSDGAAAEKQYMRNASDEIRKGTPEVAQAAREASDAVVNNYNPSEKVEEEAEQTKNTVGGLMDFVTENGVDLNNIADADTSAFLEKYTNLDLSGAAESSILSYNEAAEFYGATSTDVAGSNSDAILQEYLDKAGYENVAEEDIEAYARSMYENGEVPVDIAESTAGDIEKAYEEADTEEAGKVNDENLAKGMDNSKGIVRDAGTVVASEGANGASSQYPMYENTGSWLGEGIIKGLYSKIADIHEAACRLAEEGTAGVEETWDENSPSKVGKSLGEFFILGIANGLDDRGNVLGKTVEDSSTSVLTSLRNSMIQAMSMLDSDMDYNPTITPVLDSSQIQYGMRGLSSILNGAPYANIGAKVSVGKVDVGSAVGELSSVTSQGNTELLDALRAQSRQTEHLIYLLENQKIYLDGNTLVGKTISRIDNALGQRAVLAGRRG